MDCRSSSPVAASACHRGAPHLSASAWNITPHSTASATTESSSDAELPPNTCAHATPYTTCAIGVACE